MKRAPSRRPTRADPIEQEIEPEPVARRSRGRSTNRTRKGQVLARLAPVESASVLRSLLERHPELVTEAEEIATASLSDVDAAAIAEDVEQAMLDLDIDDLGARAGSKSWGYVAPTEAAWELLGEAVEPFIDEMKRQIQLGFETAAIRTCAGIVLGLYRCRGKKTDQALGWAEDFPVETAADAVATLARESAAKHRCTWRLPDAIVDRVPDWIAMIGRASGRSRRARS